MITVYKIILYKGRGTKFNDAENFALCIWGQNYIKM